MYTVKVIKSKEFLVVAYAILRYSQKSIDICTYKFEISKNKSAQGLNNLIKTLEIMAFSGVKVRILLEISPGKKGVSRYNIHAAGELKKMGILCRTLPRERCQHAKLILVDDEIAIIGSHNWTPKSMTSNYEISVVIRSRSILQNTKEYFDKMWQKGVAL